MRWGYRLAPPGGGGISGVYSQTLGKAPPGGLGVSRARRCPQERGGDRSSGSLSLSLSLSAASRSFSRDSTGWSARSFSIGPSDAPGEKPFDVTLGTPECLGLGDESTAKPDSVFGLNGHTWLGWRGWQTGID